MVTHVLAWLSNDNLWRVCHAIASNGCELIASSCIGGLGMNFINYRKNESLILYLNIQDGVNFMQIIRVTIHSKSDWGFSAERWFLVEYGKYSCSWSERMELAISTRREAQDPKLQNNIFVKKTDMASAVHPFDLSNIAIPLLTFGHLGSEIVGPDRWKNLLAQEIPNDLMDASCQLLTKNSLSPMQRLSLTPIPLLSPDELQCSQFSLEL
ncbi:hypothetical protein B0H13DRAFT_1926163 [Mycena leptocephala]|nr:hypothetical protein B0H13DRAFT_1926163 [Mycena leptocephala]